MASTQLIAELRSEIAELRKRVSALEEKFNQKEIKDLEDVSKLSLICVFEPNTSYDHENDSQSVDQCPAPDLPDSSSVSPVCDITETQDSQQHNASALNPQIPGICTVLKKESVPMEISGPAGINGIADDPSLEEREVSPVCKNECPQEVQLGSGCEDGKQQTGLKVCSVNLVDCGEMLKQGTESAEVSSQHRQLSSKNKKICQTNCTKRRIECPICGKSLASKSMNVHMNMHTGVKIYPCTQCGRKFRYLMSYKRHVKIHERKRLLQNLDKHNAVQIRQLGFPCTVCGKVLSYSNTLKSHMRMHSGDGPHKCIHCELVFTDRDAYVSHLRYHNREKTYTCTYCTKQFVFKFSFKEHVRMHTGEKPYRCTFCEKRFTHLSTFTRHVKKHKGFTCSVCSENFINKVRLIAHQSIHTGDKQNVCSQCGKHFLMRAHLKNHEKSHAKKNQDVVNSTSQM